MKKIAVLFLIIFCLGFSQGKRIPDVPQFVQEQKVAWDKMKELPGYSWTKAFGFGWGKLSYVRKVFLVNGFAGLFVDHKVELSWIAYCDKDGIVSIVFQGIFPKKILQKIQNWKVREENGLTLITTSDEWTSAEPELMYPPTALGRILLRLQNAAGVDIAAAPHIFQ